MRAAKPAHQFTAAERLNFLLTNRIPRRSLTLFMGWFSKIENPVVRAVSMAAWRLFADDLRLHEAKKQRFASMHDCFIRELAPGARPVHAEPGYLTSPCDAVVGAFGKTDGLEVIQAKGFPYTIDDLFGDPAVAETYRDGRFMTLRLKSSMYHRFHAPCDGRIDDVTYISGDTWNVNPVAIRRVERLFCKNERAVVLLRTAEEAHEVALVAVAAILVASMRIHGIEQPLNLRYRGPNRLRCGRTVRRGDELGYFEHGSTILLFTKPGYSVVDGIETGRIVRMGEPLMRSAAET